MFFICQFAEKKGFELIRDRLECDDLDSAVSRGDRGSLLWLLIGLLLHIPNLFYIFSRFLKDLLSIAMLFPINS